MHLPYPARKDSNAARYKPARPPSASSGYIPPILRRIRLRGGLIIAVVTFACFYLFFSISRASTASRSIKRSGAQHPITTHDPTGNPPAVLVTVMDSGLHSNSYLQNLKENRLTYAKKHGMFENSRLLSLPRTCRPVLVPRNEALPHGLPADWYGWSI